MQATMQLVAAPLGSRLQRPLSSRMTAPAGLTPLAGRGRAVRRPRAVAARAQLEDALGAAADSAPSAFHSLAAHLTTGMFLLGDAADQLAGAAAGSADAVGGAAGAAVDAAAAVGDAAAQAGDAAAEVVTKNGGFFGGFATAFEQFLKVLDDGFEKVGVPYSYGFAIIFLTVLVKVATYPLTKKQVESTLSMQALAPKVKEMQAKYANDPERLQVETARVYQTAGVNPLAGCLPSLATIPVFIGLYRALSNVADEGLLTEGFFWIPSLAGPTTVNGGLGWLYSWENGAPPLGFAQTAAYLVLPILLIISQYVSMKVISPQQSQDPSQQQANAILKFLPIMIGYFSLNVPSGLTLYWFTNNILTTAQQLYLRRSFQAAEAVVAGGGGGPAASAVIDVTPEEDKKPSGKELNARRSPKDGGSGEKFRAIKAREAAAKAAAQAGSSNGAAAAEVQHDAGGAVAVVAEVVSESDSEGEQQQHEAVPGGGKEARAKGGKKKGSKRNSWRTVFALVSALTLGCCASRPGPSDSEPSDAAAATLLAPRPNTANCSKLFLEQPVDQSCYNRDCATWQQRYYLCDSFYNAFVPAAPILFYVGNEGAVPKAVNTSGLMWQMAAELGGLLVFGEHRYYGVSQPENSTDAGAASFRYLSVEQALTDQIKLIQHARTEHGSRDAPVAVFGASYGGMLAAWLRARYPQVVAGALASSAPLQALLVEQGWDPSAFWQVVTKAASPEAGAAPACRANVRAAFAALFEAAGSAGGRALVERQLRMCTGAFKEEGGASMVALFAMMSFDTAAMSSYPHPSSYFTGDPDHPLPAWPMRVMCEEMDGQLQTQEELLGALGRAVGVVSNVTGSETCYTWEAVTSLALQTASPYSGDAFTYQVCAQWVPSESFFPPNGTTDMFYDAGPFNLTQLDAFCTAQLGGGGPLPDTRTLPLLFGGAADDFAAASNILFSNGDLDPWSSGGFLTSLGDSLPAVLIEQAGHHVDLYWDEPEDPPGYADARRQIKRRLAGWLAEWPRRGVE
ncbi:inner membrane PPF-chloroplastic isoform B [Micractinium conductrix]|uniref:Inner membrane PPF-chloroplastic isoform B n=1 Tax=Micractinium conductrix TaxID=554055 RepID=A0A2P6V1E6_9CHLO|nr:inner membrane PPF-chloroplastic isoform B [Micractinium conductrix]|eukprot:PSC67864.1 inner membrane PPF-chloroplastic isoform B [Micractinium conductrix]